MVFISHSHKDAEYIDAFVDLLKTLGITNEHLFCSSIPGFGIPLSEDIFDFLKHCFNDYELLVVFAISKDNYYGSPACMNEMGAAWIQGLDSIAILLPGMSPEEQKGAIGPNLIAISLDSPDAKYRLNELRDKILGFLSLPQPDYTVWENDRDKFLAKTKDILPVTGGQSASLDVEQIIIDLSKSTQLLSDTLLAARGLLLKHDFSEEVSWIDKEIVGYDKDDEIPEYRKARSTDIRYTGFNYGKQVSNAPLPLDLIDSAVLETVASISLLDPIDQIQAMAMEEKDPTRDITFPLASIISSNTNELLTCLSIRQIVSKTNYKRLLAGVKIRLMDSLRSLPVK